MEMNYGTRVMRKWPPERHGTGSCSQCEQRYHPVRAALPWARAGLPSRVKLPHEIPSWVDPSKEIYFNTIGCRERGRNQLAEAAIASALLDTVHHRQEKCLWWPYVFLLMPDHLHALLSFPPCRKSLRVVISKWKEWTAKQLSIEWQQDFFEHRLRHEESRREKAEYILANPVRAGLADRAEMAFRLFR